MIGDMDTCLRRFLWAFFLASCPMAPAIWASNQCGDQTPRWPSAIGGDALRGAGLIRRGSSSIKLPRMPFHGPGQDPSGWDGMMIPMARVGVTTPGMSRLVESLSWLVKSEMASRTCAGARAKAWEKWEATNPHHRPLPPSGRREADSAAG